MLLIRTMSSPTLQNLEILRGQMEALRDSCFVRNISRIRNYASERHAEDQNDENLAPFWRTFIHDLRLLSEDYYRSPISPQTEEKFNEMLDALMTANGEFLH